MDYRAFEQRVLDVLFTTRDPVTPVHLGQGSVDHPLLPLHARVEHD